MLKHFYWVFNHGTNTFILIDSTRLDNRFIVCSSLFSLILSLLPPHVSMHQKLFRFECSTINRLTPSIVYHLPMCSRYIRANGGNNHFHRTKFIMPKNQLWFSKSIQVRYIVRVSVSVAAIIIITKDMENIHWVLQWNRANASFATQLPLQLLLCWIRISLSTCQLTTKDIIVTT